MVWAKCIEGASSGYKPDKGGLIIDWVVAPSRGEDVLKTKVGLKKHKW